MTDRPILFSALMIRALLDGRKTQTRRVIKPQPFVDKMGNFCTPRKVGGHWNWGQHTTGKPCVRNFIEQRIQIRVGDRLWAKETWRPFSIDLAPWDIEVSYAADGARRTIKDGEFGDNDWSMPKAAERGNVSPLFMPRWASRITLTVTDVRVERLQDISEADAFDEGVWHGNAYNRFADDLASSCVPGMWFPGATDWYKNLWDRINGPGAWDANPWVAAYTFTVALKNINEAGR